MPIDPPSLSNIIAIEAPKYGRGEYSIGNINEILGTAYSGFCAAYAETKALNPNYQIVIHTGHWGCGAYGGNKVIMTALQIIAAHLAKIDKLIYHCKDSPESFTEAINVLAEILKEENLNLSTIINLIHSKEYKWGLTSGN